MEQVSPMINHQFIKGMVEQYRLHRIRPVSHWFFKYLDIRDWYRHHIREISDDDKAYIKENVGKMPDD
jgi:hypothetical protein